MTASRPQTCSVRKRSIDARVTLAQTLMTTMEDREALAKIVMDAAAVLRRRELRGLRHTGHR